MSVFLVGPPADGKGLESIQTESKRQHLVINGRISRSPNSRVVEGEETESSLAFVWAYNLIILRNVGCLLAQTSI